MSDRVPETTPLAKFWAFVENGPSPLQSAQELMEEVEEHRRLLTPFFNRDEYEARLRAAESKN